MAKQKRPGRAWRNRFIHGMMGLVALMFAMAMSACAPPTTQWSPAESPRRNQMDLVSFRHDVHFSVGANAFSPVERDRLDSFLVDVGASNATPILVGAMANESFSNSRQAFDRRVAAVSVHLKTRGLGLRPQSYRRDEISPPGSVRLVVKRYIVTPAECSDWHKPPGADRSNSAGANFGCATERNLGLMIADPGDLVMPRPMGPADGEAGARAIKRYREGESGGQSAPASPMGSLSGGQGLKAGEK